jgi:ParB family chromosome partitioning protein
MMNKPASGLGRGLSALLEEAVRPTTDAPAAAPPGSVREVEVARIKPNPKQPRVHFDEQAIAELAESLAERGVLQPILLRPSAEGFEIVAGERRWRAAQRARLHTIPAIVRDIDDSMAAEIALIENVQREDLNAIEEAEGYRQLIERHGHTQDEVARLVHKSRSHVANLLRLLALPEAVRNALLRGDISMGHARAIASAPDPEKLVAQVIEKGLSVRQAEDLARKAKPGANNARPAARIPATAGNADIEALERQLSDVMGLKVRVEHKGAGGKVLLHYSSLDQLDMICQRLSGEPI